jgi:hypothetical protein
VVVKWAFWKLAPKGTLDWLRLSQYKTNCPADLARPNTTDINE